MLLGVTIVEGCFWASLSIFTELIAYRLSEILERLFLSHLSALAKRNFRNYCLQNSGPFRYARRVCFYPTLIRNILKELAALCSRVISNIKKLIVNCPVPVFDCPAPETRRKGNADATKTPLAPRFVSDSSVLGFG